MHFTQHILCRYTVQHRQLTPLQRKTDPEKCRNLVHVTGEDRRRHKSKKGGDESIPGHVASKQMLRPPHDAAAQIV